MKLMLLGNRLLKLLTFQLNLKIRITFSGNKQLIFRCGIDYFLTLL